jgi:hypothetical protein
MAYPGRRTYGKQEGIIHFTRNHSILSRDKVIKDRKVPSPGYSGTWKGDPDFYAKVWLHK